MLERSGIRPVLISHAASFPSSFFTLPPFIFPFVLHPLSFLCILLISPLPPPSLPPPPPSLCSTYKIWQHSKI